MSSEQSFKLQQRKHSLKLLYGVQERGELTSQSVVASKASAALSLLEGSCRAFPLVVPAQPVRGQTAKSKGTAQPKRKERDLNSDWGA